MIKQLFLALIMAALFSGHAFAAEAEDFSYKGIKLGDEKQAMDKAFGETKVKMEKLAAERWITYYVFKEVRIGIDLDTQRIVDIRSSDKDYMARNGVKIGATNHKILKEYGKAVKERVGGRQYYIYRYNDQRLMFDMTPNYLEEIRLTNLAE